MYLHYYNGLIGADHREYSQRLPLFERDGGLTESATRATNRARLLSINRTGFTNPGHTFVGWYFNGVRITDGRVPAELTISMGKVVVVAHWQANTYSITFNSDRPGVANPAPLNVTFGTATPSLPVLPPVAGWIFQGWFTARNGGGFQYGTAAGTPMGPTLTPTFTRTSNLQLHAHWIVDPATTPRNVTVNISNTGTSAGAAAAGNTITSTHTTTMIAGQTFTVTANPVAGWQVAAVWSLTNVTQTAGGTGATRTFQVTGTGNVTVSVVFAPDPATTPRNVTVNISNTGTSAGAATAGNTITSTHTTTMTLGQTFTVTATHVAGWRVAATWSLTNATQTAGGTGATRTFQVTGTGNVTVSVAFFALPTDAISVTSQRIGHGVGSGPFAPELWHAVRYDQDVRLFLANFDIYQGRVFSHFTINGVVHAIPASGVLVIRLHGPTTIIAFYN